METCKYGSGADKRKPTAVKRKGVVYRAYKSQPKRLVRTWKLCRTGWKIWKRIFVMQFNKDRQSHVSSLVH